MEKYDGPVVITGMGAVSPFGLGAESIWSALQTAQRQGATTLDAIWSTLEYGEWRKETQKPTEQPIWGMRVEESQVINLLGKRGLQFCRPGTKFLLGASVLAMQEAGLANGDTDPDELGITIGSNLTGIQSMVDYDFTAITEGPHFTSPMEAPNTLTNAPASYLAIRLKARALNTTLASGQCAALDTLGYAMKAVRAGRARQIVAGGVEELTPAALWSYYSAHALSGGCLEDAGRPFDEQSTGWLPSEGAAVVVLERKKDALARDAHPLAELAGWSSAFAPSQAPEKRAAVLFRTAKQALTMAGVLPAQLDVVISGASGLKAQDLAEALALQNLLEENPAAVVTAVKETLGESYGASGLFQALAAVYMLNQGLVPAAPRGVSQGSQRLTGFPGKGLLTETHLWSGKKRRTALLLAQDLFGSTSAVVLRGCEA
jgi:3-oxoacyl-[acyl-carrier-protein] synthase II